MEKEETRLVEEGNTIYEIDMDCIRKKQLAANQEQQKENRETPVDSRLKPKQDFS